MFQIKHFDLCFQHGNTTLIPSRLLTSYCTPFICSRTQLDFWSFLNIFEFVGRTFQGLKLQGMKTSWKQSSKLFPRYPIERMDFRRSMILQEEGNSLMVALELEKQGASANHSSTKVANIRYLSWKKNQFSAFLKMHPLSKPISLFVRNKEYCFQSYTKREFWISMVLFRILDYINFNQGEALKP